MYELFPFNYLSLYLVFYGNAGYRVHARDHIIVTNVTDWVLAKVVWHVSTTIVLVYLFPPGKDYRGSFLRESKGRNECPP